MGVLLLRFRKFISTWLLFTVLTFLLFIILSSVPLFFSETYQISVFSVTIPVIITIKFFGIVFWGGFKASLALGFSIISTKIFWTIITKRQTPEEKKLMDFIIEFAQHYSILVLFELTCIGFIYFFDRFLGDAESGYLRIENLSININPNFLQSTDTFNFILTNFLLVALFYIILSLIANFKKHINQPPDINYVIIRSSTVYVHLLLIEVIFFIYSILIAKLSIEEFTRNIMLQWLYISFIIVLITEVILFLHNQFNSKYESKTFILKVINEWLDVIISLIIIFFTIPDPFQSAFIKGYYDLLQGVGLFILIFVLLFSYNGIKHLYLLSTIVEIIESSIKDSIRTIEVVLSKKGSFFGYPPPNPPDNLYYNSKPVDSLGTKVTVQFKCPYCGFVFKADIISIKNQPIISQPCPECKNSNTTPIWENNA